jgi:hypothetical protein
MSLSLAPRFSEVEEAATHLKVLAADFSLSIFCSGVRSIKEKRKDYEHRCC